MPNISLIACIQIPDMGIGFEGDLLYNIPEDMKRFRDLTRGHPVIMGRKTWESLPKKPLPGRLNVVITSDMNLWASAKNTKEDSNPVYVPNISMAVKACEWADGNDEIFVIGGSKIYEDFMPFANKMYLTMVPGEKQAGTFFPHPLLWGKWNIGESLQLNENVYFMEYNR